MDRRTLLGGMAAAVVSTLAGPAAVAGAGPASMPPIRSRSEWAGAPPTSPLMVEDEVRFALVHHTASGNGYAADQVPGILEGIRAFHTGPQKGWPDIAYNFLIDRFGTIWEGRAGSVDTVVRADATGGSQGFAVLCCVLGNLQSTPPTPATRQALVDLIAWQCGVQGIDPQGQTTFTSRGSNRHPPGTTVTTPTITGHRAMSYTACPGDEGMTFVAQLPDLVAAAIPSGPPHFRRAG